MHAVDRLFPAWRAADVPELSSTIVALEAAPPNEPTHEPSLRLLGISLIEVR